MNPLAFNLMHSHFSRPMPSYTIDGSDRLIDANLAFVRALPTELAIARPAELIGRSLWDFMTSTVSAQLLKVLHRRVRGIGAPVFLPMHTDSFGERRLIDLEIHALGNDDLRHVHQLIWSESHAHVSLLDPRHPRDARVLPQCVWCARVQVKPGMWLEPESAHLALALDASATLPRLQDHACTSCKQTILQLFPARAASYCAIR